MKREPLRVDSTCFICQDWSGQVVLIGWKGCLERMRFGLDSATETFHFGEAAKPPPPPQVSGDT